MNFRLIGLSKELELPWFKVNRYKHYLNYSQSLTSYLPLQDDNKLNQIISPLYHPTIVILIIGLPTQATQSSKKKRKHTTALCVAMVNP